MIKTATVWIGVGVLIAIVLNSQIVGIVDPILSKAKLSVALAS